MVQLLCYVPSTWFLHCHSRFALAHLHNQCRRKVILSYFEEEVDDVEVSGECCDVCSHNIVELADYIKKMEIVVKATDVLSGYGEKKVIIILNFISVLLKPENLFYRLLAGFMALRQWE